MYPATDKIFIFYLHWLDCLQTIIPFFSIEKTAIRRVDKDDVIVEKKMKVIFHSLIQYTATHEHRQCIIQQNK